MLRWIVHKQMDVMVFAVHLNELGLKVETDFGESGSEKTTELEPAAGLPYAMLALANAQMGRRPETLRAAENAVRFADSLTVISSAAAALAHVGQNSQAREVLGKALAMAKERYVCRFIVASAYAELRENEKAFESLDQAFLQRST